MQHEKGLLLSHPYFYMIISSDTIIEDYICSIKVKKPEDFEYFFEEISDMISRVAKKAYDFC